MPTRAIPESTIPGLGPSHGLSGSLIQQFNIGAPCAPLLETPFSDFDAPGRMNRLYPAGLFCFCVDIVFADYIEQDGCAIANKVYKAFARLAVCGFDVVGIGAGK